MLPGDPEPHHHHGHAADLGPPALAAAPGLRLRLRDLPGDPEPHHHGRAPDLGPARRLQEGPLRGGHLAELADPVATTAGATAAATVAPTTAGTTAAATSASQASARTAAAATSASPTTTAGATYVAITASPATAGTADAATTASPKTVGTAAAAITTSPTADGTTVAATTAPMVASSASASTEISEKDALTGLLLAAVYDRQLNLDGAFHSTAPTVLSSCPEVDWLVECLCRTPLPLGWHRSRGAPGEAPHYVCETSGKAYHEPPQFPYFVRLAGSVIYARLFAKETRPWVHAVLKEINSHASRENPCTWAAFVVQVVETLLKRFPSTCTRLPCTQIR